MACSIRRIYYKYAKCLILVVSIAFFVQILVALSFFPSDKDDVIKIIKHISLERKDVSAVSARKEDQSSDDEDYNKKNNKNKAESYLRIEELDFKPLCEIKSREAISAIHRAKTQKCKQQIVNTTCLIQGGKFYPKILPNTCKSKVMTYGKHLGCYQDEKKLRLLSSFYGNYININSPRTCLDICVQAGFPYAGVQYAHGDLSKPTNNARGKLASLKHWEELTSLLNSDGSGDSKSTEKWKKVWSDFKNNTKKKAARLHRAACGTGGGPAVYSKLSDLEQRVLNLIGVQVATGLALEEAGFTQDIQVEPTGVETEVILGTQIEDNDEQWNQPGPSNQPHVMPPSPHTTPLHTLENHEDLEGREEVDRIPASLHTPVLVPQPAQSGQTLAHGSPQQRSPRRFVRRSPRGLSRGSPHRSRRRSPRRLLRPARSEEAAQNFINCDREWREFRMKQHQDYMELKREQNRIRDMELRNQQEWRVVASRGLDILEKLVSNYRRDS